MLLLLNSFSANMLQQLFPVSVTFDELSASQAADMLAAGFLSVVGHADTAAVFSETLNLPVTMNRATISLKAGDTAIIGQYSGPRLPEGATTLPEGASIRWLVARVS